MQVPILTYHAGNVASNAYLGNDHVALRTDLETFYRVGWKVVPLQWVIENRLGLANHDLANCLALTCDDGTDLDFRDIEFPGFGMQRGFFGCLNDARSQAPHYYHDLHLTAFVIADPSARARMDRECLHNQGWMNETWWADAQSSGLMNIECHSWDHNHHVLMEAGPDGMTRGDFFQVDNAVKAEYEIDQALAYINQRIGPDTCRFFCYPYGHANDFLRDVYFPENAARLGLKAAFGVQGVPATMHSDIWHMPRYVCGWHWKSTEELLGVLDSCAAGNS